MAQKIFENKMMGDKQKAKKIGRRKSRSILTKKIRVIIFLSVLVFIILLVLSQNHHFKTIFSSRTSGSDILLAKVNGDAIYQSDVDELWVRLPLNYQLQINQTSILKQLVDEKLLLQEASAENIVVSDEEVSEFVTSQLSQVGKSFEEYKNSINQQNKDLQKELLVYKNQLILSKLLEKHNNVSDLFVSDEEIKDFYTSHQQEFYREPEVKVQHILISPTTNFNDSKAFFRAETILAKIKSGNLSFCEAVNNYSSDSGSISNCGIYTFKRGTMTEPFENASFSMNLGDYQLVKSSFGYHIIHKLADYPAVVLKLEDKLSDSSEKTVYDLVKQTLIQEKAKALFTKYLDSLKKEANIVIY